MPLKNFLLVSPACLNQLPIWKLKWESLFFTETIAEYNAVMATVCATIIAVVTFFICMAGLAIGKKIGTRFSNKAAILGGTILILIGLEIFITGIF